MEEKNNIVPNILLEVDCPVCPGVIDRTVGLRWEWVDDENKRNLISK